MTMTGTPDKATEFLQRQRARLSNARLLPPFRGPWAEAFVHQLQQQLHDHFHPPYDQLAVVDCFSTVPLGQVESLFHALSKACQQVRQTDESATIWATELTVYAAFRVLDPEVWAGLPAWQGQGGSVHAAVQEVPAKGTLVASLGMAMLTGRYIRLKEGGQPRGVFDLSSAPLRTDPVPGLLAVLYDSVFKDKPPRLNADVPLTEDEIGELRAEFQTYRLDKELAAPYILLPMLDSAIAEEVEREFAAQLNAPVLTGRSSQEDRFVNLQAQFTTASLKATVEKIFRLLPQLAPGSPVPTPGVRGTTTAAQLPSSASLSERSVSAPSQAPAPAYTWDVFISHTSEDKPIFVDSLAKALAAAGLRVWYDKAELAVGDSLRSAISTGLRESRFGVVVLSPRYLAASKGWAHGELDTLLTYEFNSGQTRVLPVWLDLKRADVERQAPMLAGKLAVDAAAGMPTVVQALLAAITRGS